MQTGACYGGLVITLDRKCGEWVSYNYTNSDGDAVEGNLIQMSYLDRKGVRLPGLTQNQRSLCPEQRQKSEPRIA